MVDIIDAIVKTESVNIEDMAVKMSELVCSSLISLY